MGAVWPRGLGVLVGGVQEYGLQSQLLHQLVARLWVAGEVPDEPLDEFLLGARNESVLCWGCARVCVLERY